MVWEQIETSWPHTAYATTGFALLLFGTLSLFIKEKLYIGESTLSTIYGLIVGPHCLDWFSPTKWGNTDYITLELSRIVLVVQIFAVAVELPKKYMLRHWQSVFMLLVPVMAFGWLLGSVFIWKLVPTLRWIEALAIAGCVTATDPVLASAVVGKGKFAKRVPGHLRNLLSAESACNDGMAFPFVYMALDIMHSEHHAGEIAKHFIVISVLYECVFGVIVGAVIGYASRHLIKFAEKHNLIDRESLLVYYFCLAFFCAGVGTTIGVDDLLVAFAAGSAFSWDGWFARQTEETHVSNVIDLLLNTAYFIYFGAIVPWDQFNEAGLGIRAWKLVIIAILVLLFRRIPIILALKPVIPDIKTWREALFSGHFGPIGVGGLFMAILARAEMETNTTTPLQKLPDPSAHHYFAIANIWPITCFLVISSIAVHGSSIAVFTLGKRLNNIAITMTYTTGGNNPSWISRLPGGGGPDGDMLKLEKVETMAHPAGRKPLKKKKKGKKVRKLKRTGSSVGRKTHKRRDPTEVPLSLSIDLGKDGNVERTDMVPADKLEGKNPEDIRAYREGSHVVVEDHDGNVVHAFDIGDPRGTVQGEPKLEIHEPSPGPVDADAEQPYSGESTAVGDSSSSNSPRHRKGSSSDDGNDDDDDDDGVTTDDNRSELSRPASLVNLPGRGEQVYACMVDDHVIVENADGEIIRRYKIQRRGDAPNPHGTGAQGLVNQTLRWVGLRRDPFPTHQPSHPADPIAHPDVEHTPADTLVPVGADNAPLSHQDEHHVRTHLEDMLTQGNVPQRGDADAAGAAGASAAGAAGAAAVAPPAAAATRESPRHYRPHSVDGSEDEDSEDDDEDDDDEDDDESEDEIPYHGADDDDDEETEVERRRRLAALGVIDDDGNERAGSPRSRVASIPEEEDDQKLTFHLPQPPR